jgi:CBS domain-containing protein
MKAMDIMVPDIRVVNADESIAVAKNIFMKHGIGRLPVLDGDSVVGILTENDLADAFAKARAPVDTVEVRKVMHRRVTTVKPDATLEKVAEAVLKSDAGCVIVDDNGAIGIITKTDMVKSFSKAGGGSIVVKDIMTAGVHTISPAHSMFRAAREMEEKHVSRLIVVEHGVVKGIITDRDVAFASVGGTPTRLTTHNGSSRSTRIIPLTVADVAKTNVVSVQSKTDAATAAKVMMGRHVGSVVVMDGGKLKGILTKTDIVRAMAK